MARCVTAEQISEALRRMIESGELVLPPEGCPTLTAEEVAAELGVDLDA